MATGLKNTDIVNASRFLQATRDSGYRNIDAALSELIDNALQAEATSIDILLPNPSDVEEEQFVAVLDDGHGMDRLELAAALQFGGSNRFNDRSGLGRFGMGLPNASLSQARRVDVYTWRSPRYVWHSHLDLDELVPMGSPHLPTPTRDRLPKKLKPLVGSSGTVVRWSRLDRVKAAAWKAVARRLDRRLGQKFRYFLWEGRRIHINGKPVTAFDPLFLSRETLTPWIRAVQYVDVLECPIQITQGDDSSVRSIHVRFSELPVGELTDLPNQEKRLYGISNGAGVSVVRGGREIDYGWFLLDKRRENYDDWWRCEIRFSPELDELFGVSHTKQGIRPTEELRRMLGPELGAIARKLNHRVRLAHLALAEERARNAAAGTASCRDPFLRPVPQCPLSPCDAASERGTLARSRETPYRSPKYRLVVEEADTRDFFRAELRGGEVTVILNSGHEFYQQVYQGLTVDSDHAAARKRLELALLALGRTRLLEWSREEEKAIERFVAEWSRAVSIFCGGT